MKPDTSLARKSEITQNGLKECYRWDWVLEQSPLEFSACGALLLTSYRLHMMNPDHEMESLGELGEDLIGLVWAYLK